MKRYTLLLLVAFATFMLQAMEPAQAWGTLYPQLESAIEQPTFPDRTLNILTFGAVANDTATLNHEAINSAILACSLGGGGRVVVPAGEFHTGPITLKSNVNLHLEEGAHLKFTTDYSYYLPQVVTRWEGIDCYNYRPLIYAYGETNIALTGKGKIDGQGSNDHWWYMKGNRRHGWEEGRISQLQGGRKRLFEFSEQDIPVDRRIMTPEDALRPQLINFIHCERVLIEGVELLNSPFWVIHPMFCNNLTVRNVSIISHGPNSDGCDPESCNNVLIEGCYFDTGDDCIAIKSGRNNDGRRSNVPSQNMIVRNCRMKNGHGGVVVGSEITGGYRNLFVHDCEMDSPLLDRVLRIKTNACRGGVIENIYARNITVGQCKEAVLKINLVYEPNEECRRDFPPVVRNVYMENVTCQKSAYGVFIEGLPDHDNVTNIEVSNCRFEGVANPNRISDATNVRFENLLINGKKVKSPK